jgi:hypothetical protein
VGLLLVAACSIVHAQQSSPSHQRAANTHPAIPVERLATIRAISANLLVAMTTERAGDDELAQREELKSVVDRLLVVDAEGSSASDPSRTERDRGPSSADSRREQARGDARWAAARVVERAGATRGEHPAAVSGQQQRRMARLRSWAERLTSALDGADADRMGRLIELRAELEQKPPEKPVRRQAGTPTLQVFSAEPAPNTTSTEPAL